jgi:CheY-like chemotaxis protein
MKIENILFITSKRDCNAYIECFDYSNVIFFSHIKDSEIPESSKNYKTEYSFHRLCEDLDSIDTSQTNSFLGIVIDFKLIDDATGRDTINLAHHIRLNDFRKNTQLSRLPIIIAHYETIRFGNKKYSHLIDYGLFASKGAFFYTFNELLKNDEIDGHINLYNIIQRLANEFDFKNYIEKVSIVQTEKTTRHQISNEWGAVKLALNAGYSQSEIDYNFPPTLYFKYLTKKYQNQGLTDSDREGIVNSLKNIPNGKTIPTEKINFSNLLKNKKVLLIDDNAKRGWAAVLSKLFNECTIDVKTDYELVNQMGYLIEISKYDLVFLDLRLPKLLNNDVQYKYGIDLLNKIKMGYPHIPLIIFTASNKSWTLEEVLNLGADGMYVKESPEYANDFNFSKGNFTSFTKTVVDCLLKYTTLRPYWDNIEQIFKDQNFISIGEQTNTKFKERIKERLEMFYGLLKRGFEETSYNQEKFHFSNYELAFMTLWSILNEISEINFEKHTSNPNPKVNLPSGINSHPDNSNISPLYDTVSWNIKEQPSEVFFEYVWEIETENNGNLKLHYSNKYKLINRVFSYITFNEQNNFFDDQISNYNPEKNLYLQIAFLIKNKHLFSCVNNKNYYLDKIYPLNKIRNRLYLTHGDDISLGFYSKTEREKRGDENNTPMHNINPQGDIKDLFELVSLLLTGKEIRISF